jgi:hypothetical protein
MKELISQGNPLLGIYLMSLFLSVVVFTYSNQTDGFIFRYIKKGFIYKVLAYISIFFYIPIIIEIYNRLKYDK